MRISRLGSTPMTRLPLSRKISASMPGTAADVGNQMLRRQAAGLLQSMYHIVGVVRTILGVVFRPVGEARQRIASGFSHAAINDIVSAACLPASKTKLPLVSSHCRRHPPGSARAGQHLWRHRQGGRISALRPPCRPGLRQVQGLPWQRILGSGGRIAVPGEYAMEQRFLLEAEGVRFKGRRVDLALFEHRFAAGAKTCPKAGHRLRGNACAESCRILSPYSLVRRAGRCA